MIRPPDFVKKEDFERAVQEATKKKKQDFFKVEFFPYDEGLCVQCMHIGAYNDEPATVDLMHDYIKAPNPIVTFYCSLTERTLCATIVSKHTRFSTYLRTYLFISNL